MRRARTLGLSLSLTMLATVTTGLWAFADKEYTDVRIVIRDSEKGEPVPRAGITLKFVRGKKFLKKERSEWEVKTDSRGEATVPYVPSGKVRVLVIAKGFQTYGEDVDVSGEEQTVTVKLNRPQSQYSSHETPEERAKREAAKKNP